MGNARMIYVDFVKLRSGETEEVRGYSERNAHASHMEWLWSDETLLIPWHEILSIATIEDESPDA